MRRTRPAPAAIWYPLLLGGLIAPRDVEYDLGILTQWIDPADAERHIRWTRECRRRSTLAQDSTADAYLPAFGSLDV